MEPETTPETQPEPTPTPDMPKEKGGIGPVIGIIVILILIALGGFYYFTTGIDQITDHSGDAAMMEDGDGTQTGEEESLRQQGESSDLADIEADLEATDFSGLDDASADFESELNAQ